MNLGARWQKLQVLLKHYDHVLILSTVLCQVNLGYLYHHLWSETWKTGYSMGVAVRLELALDLVKKMEQAKESTLRKFPKTLQGRYFIKFVGQNLIN